MARRYWASGVLAVAMMGLAAYFGAQVAVRSADAKPEPKAKPMPALRAAFVAMADVQTGSKRWQEMAKKMVAKREEAAKRLTVQRASFTELQQKAQKATPAEQAKLFGEVIAAQRRFEDDERAAMSEIDKEAAAALAEMQTEFAREIEAMARERQLDVVYGYPMYIEKAIAQNGKNPAALNLFFRPEAPTPLYLRAELDLTADLIDRLNAKHAEKDDD